MTKRIISLTLSVILLMTMVMPSVSMAEDKPKWWERALDIVVADALGALEGYLETESTGGAIVGGIAGSLEEGLDQGISGGNWTMDEEYAESIGLYHNKGLNFYFDQEDSENINAINEKGGIKSTGDLDGFAKIKYAGNNIEKVIS